jgi:hypothetical protein
MLELVLGIVLTSIILMGMGSTLFIASRAVPNPQQDPQASIIAGRIVDQLAEELSSALCVTELTTTAMAFTVPSRDGDAIPERIRYAWTGAAGGPLTRQYNGGATVTLAQNVNAFALTPSTASVQETYPAVCVESSMDTLIVDNMLNNNLDVDDVQATSSQGQYFKPSLGSGVWAWRPSILRFMAMKNSVPGTTLVQIRPSSANMTPTGAVIEQKTLTDGMLNSYLSWQQFSLTQQNPIVPGGAICLALVNQTGTKSATVLHNSNSGQLHTNSGGQWSYDTNHSLYCRLYGKLFTSSGNQYINSTYLTSLGIQLQIASSTAVIRTSAAMLNHPELLANLWELKFDRAPTAVECNGDGQADWTVEGGGTFDATSLQNCVWTSTGTFLDTSPACNFTTTAVVDLRCQNTTTGGSGATFTINALRSGSLFAPLRAYLALQPDGTQTLTVAEQLSSTNLKVLIVIPGLPNALVDLHFIIDPTSLGISVTANGVQYGTFPLIRVTSTDANAFASIGSSGGTSKFAYARIRVFRP